MQGLGIEPTSRASAGDREIRPTVLRAVGLTKLYRMGEVEVPALRGVDPGGADDSPPHARPGAAPDRRNCEPARRRAASIVVWEGRDRLLLLSGAVFRQGTGWAAYTVDRDRVRLRSVELGRGNGAQVEVTRGLEPGERAILYPTDNVRDGVRVEE